MAKDIVVRCALVILVLVNLYLLFIHHGKIDFFNLSPNTYYFFNITLTLFGLVLGGWYFTHRMRFDHSNISEDNLKLKIDHLAGCLRKYNTAVLNLLQPNLSQNNFSKNRVEREVLYAEIQSYLELDKVSKIFSDDDFDSLNTYFSLIDSSFVVTSKTESELIARNNKTFQSKVRIHYRDAVNRVISKIL